MRFIALDTETGNLDPFKGSLLTAYFGVFDSKLILIDDLDLKIKPNRRNDPYLVSAGALSVNKIDLVKHDCEALTQDEANKYLTIFLQKNKPEGERLIPLGHNIPFDLAFLHEHLIGSYDWEKYCEHRVLDTQVVANFLRLNGVLNVRSVALQSLKTHFGLPSVQSHTAKNDALSTVLLLRKLNEMVGTKNG